MAEFKLERFKYNWRGTWTLGIAYKRDDVVRVNGKSYVCVITHVASATFREDLDAILPGSVPPQPQPKWVVMTNGLSFVGNWTTATDYNLGDIAKYNGSLWACTVNHNSTNFAANISNWTAFTQTTSYVGDWQSTTDYTPGDVVSYNGNAHKCVVAHTSEQQLEASSENWQLYRDGLIWTGAWQSLTNYRLNDLVKYGGTIFKCIESHSSTGNSIDDTKFKTEVFGSQYDGTWTNATY
jgi:hypothetical protein